jgi:hypothetical protein
MSKTSAAQTSEQTAATAAPEAIRGIQQANEQARSNLRLSPERLQINSSTQVYNLFDAVPQVGTKLEDMLEPKYWEHVASKLRPWDHIEVRAEDGSFYAQLIVQRADRLTADVRPIQFADLNVGAPSDGDIPSGYAVDYGGPIAKWRVLTGGTVVRDGFQQKGSAIQWVVNRGKASR